MNLTNYFKRVELDRFSSHVTGNQPQRNRRIRDPFEGDPFKIQSLKFHYADKPPFYPVSNRDKELPITEKQSEVKNIYYNHDHSIPKRDKENIPLRSSQTSASTYESKSFCPQKSASAVSSISNKLASDSVESGLTVKKSHARTFISQPTMSASNSRSSYNESQLTKRPLKASNASMASSIPLSTANVPGANSGCHITIKINGVPKNRVQIKRSNGNVEINMTKFRKTKPQSPKSPERSFRLKPSRSYVIHKGDTTATPTLDVGTNTTSNKRPKVSRESSTHSMVPHREESSQSVSAGETYRSRSSILPNLCKSNKTLNKHATLLEKILTHNPIVIRSRMRESNSTSRLTQARGSSNPLNRANGKIK